MDLILWLIRHGANLEIKNNLGLTPMDYIVKLVNDGDYPKLEIYLRSYGLEEMQPTILYQPGSRWLNREGFAPIYKVENKPKYKREIYNTCGNDKITKYEIMEKAIELGINRERIKNLTKEEICKEMIKYIELL